MVRNRMRLWSVFAVLATCMFATPAHAHDWYPIECCSGLDCAPVDHARVIQGGYAYNLPGSSAQAAGPALEVTTKHGTAIVPPGMTRRESRDHRMHACIRKTWNGETRVICVFIPPPT